MINNQPRVKADPMDVSDRVFLLLHELTESMGSEMPYPIVERAIDIITKQSKALQPSKDAFELVVLNDFRLHFEQLQQTEDVQEKSLHEVCGNIFMRLYRELVKIEPDEPKRYLYLEFCYALHDEDQPKDLSKAEALDYRLNFIDRVNVQVHKLIGLLVLDDENMVVEVNQKRPKCMPGELLKYCRSNLILKPSGSKYFTIWHKVKMVGFARLEGDKPLVYNWMKGLMSTRDVLLDKKKLIGIAKQLIFGGSRIEQEDPIAVKINMLQETKQRRSELLESLEFRPPNQQLANEAIQSAEVLLNQAKNYIENRINAMKQLEAQQTPTDIFQAAVEINSEDEEKVDECEQVLPAQEPPMNQGNELLERKPYMSGNMKLMIRAPCSIIKLLQQQETQEQSRTTENFFWQLRQFHRIVCSAPSNTFDLLKIKTRLRQALHNIRNELPDSTNYETFRTEVEKLQLMPLLSDEDRAIYESLRAQRELPPIVAIFKDQHIATCSLSERFLRQRLCQLSASYRVLKQQQSLIFRLGDSGAILACNLHQELLQFRYFCIQPQPQLSYDSLLNLLYRTRGYHLQFEWLLELTRRCLRLAKSQSLLWALQLHRGLGNREQEALLGWWLLQACRPEIERIVHWLRHGELPAGPEKFFIEATQLAVAHADYWLKGHKLNLKHLPPFLSPEQAKQLFEAGQNRRLLGQLPSLSAVELRQRLMTALEKLIEDNNATPLQLLITNLHDESLGELLFRLETKESTLVSLRQLRKYLLLTDVEFVQQLLEHMEPALAQPAHCYDKKLLELMMEQLKREENSNLYVDKANSGGSYCWSHFLLGWNLRRSLHPLLGPALSRYTSLFPKLWMLHYSGYVLRERCWRQQRYFRDRFQWQLAQLDEVERMQLFLLRPLLHFMNTLLGYVQVDVIGDAFGQLRRSCEAVQYADELLAAHARYLDRIEAGIFQTQEGVKCSLCLEQMCALVHQLDAQQLKFVGLCQQLSDHLGGRKLPKSLHTRRAWRFQEFRWSCHNMRDDLLQMKIEFRRIKTDFLMALNLLGLPKYLDLVRSLDGYTSY